MFIGVEIDRGNASIPTKATLGSACIDLIADEDKMIYKHVPAIIGTGLRIRMAPGYMMQIYSRSGLTAKHGIVVANAPGIIDSDYRGEIKVILTSFYDDKYQVKKGDKIAQAVVMPVAHISFKEEVIPVETARGEGGLGSTGR